MAKMMSSRLLLFWRMASDVFDSVSSPYETALDTRPGNPMPPSILSSIMPSSALILLPRSFSLPLIPDHKKGIILKLPGLRKMEKLQGHILPITQFNKDSSF